MISRHLDYLAEVIPLFSHVIFFRKDLSAWYRHITNDTIGKHFERASRSLKSLSDIITIVEDQLGLCFLRTLTSSSIKIFVSSATMKSPSISLKPLLLMTNRR